MKKINLISVLFYIVIIFLSCRCNSGQNSKTVVYDSLTPIPEKKQLDDISWADDSHGYFVDNRDNKKYGVIKIGSQIIMSENFAYKPNSGNFWAYSNNSSNITKYGYLYDWKTAKSISPVGWHLPTKNDWEKLYKFLGNNDNKVYQALKVGGSSGFNALLSGARGPNGEFDAVDLGAIFWSSTTLNNKQAWSFGCTSASSEAGLGQDEYICGYSVRLFKD